MVIRNKGLINYPDYNPQDNRIGAHHQPDERPALGVDAEQEASGPKSGREATGGEAGEPRKEKPKNDWKFFHTNFNMERAQKIIEDCIEERLLWDRFSRNYDSWRALQLAEGLAAEIRDRVKKLNHRR